MTTANANTQNDNTANAKKENTQKEKASSGEFKPGAKEKTIVVKIKRKTLLRTAGAVVTVAAAGAAGYLFWKHRQEVKDVVDSATTDA